MSSSQSTKNKNTSCTVLAHLHVALVCPLGTSRIVMLLSDASKWGPANGSAQKMHFIPTYNHLTALPKTHTHTLSSHCNRLFTYGPWSHSQCNPGTSGYLAQAAHHWSGRSFCQPSIRRCHWSHRQPAPSTRNQQLKICIHVWSPKVFNRHGLSMTLRNKATEYQ